MSEISDKERLNKLSVVFDKLHETLSPLEEPSKLAQKVVSGCRTVLGVKFSSIYIDENPFGNSIFAQAGSKNATTRKEPQLLIAVSSRGKMIEKKGIDAVKIGLSHRGKVNCLIAPIPIGKWTGSLCAAKPSGEGFAPSDKVLLAMYAKQCGLAIQYLDLNEQITRLIDNDPLTDLPHCQAFYGHLIKSIRRAKNKSIPLSLMLIDIDNFRAYNDRFGHHEGNQLLREVSTVFRENCKYADEIPCRYGGEEFAIILEGKGPEKSHKTAHSISDDVRNLHAQKRAKAEVTVSIGMATFPGNGKDESDLLLAVDNALYYAKALGPNNAFHFDDLPDQSTDFKPMIEALSQTLIQQASEEASEEGLSIVEKLRDELEWVLNRAKGEATPELIGREAVFSLAATVDARDIYTRGHSEQVATYAHQIAEAIGLSPEEAELIYISGFLHDIGKIIIPDFILNKAETLLPIEWTPIREHPAAGVRILEPFEGLQKVLPIVLHHHERWNGKGYPLGLRRNQIPLGARIIAVADSFDAMTSNRCYRSEKSIEEALEELRKNCGSQFDPAVVEAFLKLGFGDFAKKR